MSPTADKPAPGAVRKRHWLRWTVLGSGALAAAYLLWTVLTVVFAAGEDNRGTTDAIVVLGAAQYDGTPSPVLQTRLDHALELYEQGVAPEIVLTGSKQEADRFTEAYAGFTYLLGRGVPEDAMAVVTDGTSTYESLAATARVLEREGSDAVTLVSDGFHNRRLQGIASELGLTAEVSPSSSGLTVDRVARESAVVAVGELIGFRRLQRFS
ncbi:MAG: YdcF family protein [Actinomycetia bacterium]|nr:YdcF family protein [Actinomycetes bacterium]